MMDGNRDRQTDRGGDRLTEGGECFNSTLSNLCPASKIQRYPKVYIENLSSFCLLVISGNRELNTRSPTPSILVGSMEMQ